MNAYTQPFLYFLKLAWSAV